MKNKKLIYILLPLVLLIWGIIFYKIFTRIDISNNDQASFFKPEKSDTIAKKDTFILIADYRDPFLDQPGFVNYKSEKENEELKLRTERSMPPPAIQFPDIKYNGLIINAKNKNKIGLFMLNNKYYILKEGETKEEVLITKLFKDSVFIQFEKHKKTIKINNK
jgi:hypothetical protein